MGGRWVGWETLPLKQRPVPSVTLLSWGRSQGRESPAPVEGAVGGLCAGRGLLSPRAALRQGVGSGCYDGPQGTGRLGGDSVCLPI